MIDHSVLKLMTMNSIWECTINQAIVNEIIIYTFSRPLHLASYQCSDKFTFNDSTACGNLKN